MCGIAGFRAKVAPSDKAISKALASMKNRGPDSQHVYFGTGPNSQVGLLFARLSIIDLNERSNQPFTIGDYTIVFNGEIYNFLELKKEMELEGVRFRTSSDTEVLLTLFIREGIKCLTKLEGMWAFAIHKTGEDKLLLCRDRFGEKPLYFVTNEKGFFFASETRTLKEFADSSFTPNQNLMARYLVNGYKSIYKHNDTWYEEIRELPPSCFLEVDGKGQVKVHEYYKPVYRPIPNMTTQEAIEGVKENLIESVRIRLRSDVPLAFCLSGGVDSTALASIATKVFGQTINSFSIIESDERYNELDNIQATIDDLNCKPEFIHLDRGDYLSNLIDLVEYHDAPVATITYLVHSFISKAIHEKGFKVAFSGTAADELFTGYYDHYNLLMYDLRNHPDHGQLQSDWWNSYGKFVRNPFLKDPDLFIKDPSFRGHIYLKSEEFIKYLKVDLEDPFTEKLFTSESLLRNRMLNELFEESTRVILHEDDLNSMKYSIENRSPFLDRKLFEFAYSVPNHLLIKNGYGKYLLREAVSGILNDKVRLDKRKRGFNASIDSVINFEDKATLDYLLDPSAKVFEFVKRDKIAPLLSNHGKENSDSKFIFNFINLRIFLK